MSSCEVCSGLGRIGTSTRRKKQKIRTRRILVGERIVALCDDHAREVSDSDVATVSDLRHMFMEPGGKRSLVGRRSPLDRRIFPARPEGRRRGQGRRHDDAE